MGSEIASGVLQKGLLARARDRLLNALQSYMRRPRRGRLVETRAWQIEVQWHRHDRQDDLVRATAADFGLRKIAAMARRGVFDVRLEENAKDASNSDWSRETRMESITLKARLTVPATKRGVRRGLAHRWDPPPATT